MPHSRTDTAQDDIALAVLSGVEYKVYRYLVNRADEIGVSYPAEATIAKATAVDPRSIQRALQVLHENGVFRYRRRNAFDPVRRRKISNCYQISPFIMALAANFQEEALADWDALIDQCGNVSIRLWSRINQHQEPTPESNFRISSRTTTTNRQGQLPLPALNEQGQGQLPGQGQKPPAATKHNDLNHQREAHGPKSSVPPARPKYPNPPAVNQPLGKPDQESLAKMIEDLGISLPLARGFVTEYGYDRAKSALAETMLMGTDARKPASVFRAIVQSRLADEYAIARQKFFNTRQS